MVATYKYVNVDSTTKTNLTCKIFCTLCCLVECAFLLGLLSLFQYLAAVIVDVYYFNYQG